MSLPDHILDIFREEARDHLTALEQGFLDLETAASNEARAATITELFRRAHSLKGASRAVGLDDLQDASQVLEETLDDLRQDPDKATSEAVEQGLRQFDELRRVHEQWQQPKDSPSEDAAPATTPADDAFTVRVAAERLDRMLSVAGELRISQRGAELVAQQLIDLTEDVAGFSFDHLGEVSQAARAAVRSWQSTILDQVQRIAGEAHRKRVREALLLEALEADIHEARLLPLSMLADSLRRPVRDLAQALGKSIRYEVDVGTVLLDKAVIEALKDPLLHMIRNAAHHGVEPPERRRVAAKHPEGRIVLRARRRGDLVQIDVADDGAGVDFERIRNRLRQMGDVSADEIEELGERELAAALFRPGFTTAVEVDELSGRGVGLDVVHDSVHRLHGGVQLQSSSPAGTTFRITVPVTISTARILTVTCGGQYYGIPSSAIVRTARVQEAELRNLEGSLILTVDGEPVPWVALSDLVDSPRSVTTNGQATPYVLLSESGERLAVAVDDAEDEAEVILKPLGFPLAGLSGIVGGTVRPDGSVQLVLDVASLMFSPRRMPTPAVVKEPPPQAARILVVDDSPTTRRIVHGLLAAAGYSVKTASDGLAALDLLRAMPVDLVVSDVQMPRMGGLELTRQIKSRYPVPVILVTGMEKDEDRREGMAAGADAYVVKSTFEGEGLLGIVKQFV